jgi:hypothetical protein
MFDSLIILPENLDIRAFGVANFFDQEARVKYNLSAGEIETAKIIQRCDQTGLTHSDASSLFNIAWLVFVLQKEWDKVMEISNFLIERADRDMEGSYSYWTTTFALYLQFAVARELDDIEELAIICLQGIQHERQHLRYWWWDGTRLPFYIRVLKDLGIAYSEFFEENMVFLDRNLARAAASGRKLVEIEWEDEDDELAEIEGASKGSSSAGDDNNNEEMLFEVSSPGAYRVWEQLGTGDDCKVSFDCSFDAEGDHWQGLASKIDAFDDWDTMEVGITL